MNFLRTNLMSIPIRLTPAPKVRSHYCRIINSFLLLIHFLKCLHFPTYESVATLERSFWNIFTLWSDCFDWLCLCWIFSSGYWLQKRKRVRMINLPQLDMTPHGFTNSKIPIPNCFDARNNNICTNLWTNQTNLGLEIRNWWNHLKYLKHSLCFRSLKFDLIFF